MMKLTTLLLIVFSTFQLAFAQVAIIKDPDGWTNVRETRGANSEIIHKVYENEVFWFNNKAYEKGEDWILIYIPKNDFSLGNSGLTYLEGFIHKSRLLPLDSIKPYTGSNFKFEYEIKAFDQTGRVVGRDEDNYIFLIDGRSFWGTDGEFPKTEVKNISVEINGQKIEVHKVFYNDIFECDNSFRVCESNGAYFVYQSNSDGAGGYDLIWVFDKNGLKQRLVGSMTGEFM